MLDSELYKKHIPKLLDVSIYHKYRFRAVQIRIYHIPKRTDNAHMKERFGTVQKTHIPKRLYADKLCLERFGAVQIRIYQNEFLRKVIMTGGLEPCKNTYTKTKMVRLAYCNTVRICTARIYQNDD